VENITENGATAGEPIFMETSALVHEADTDMEKEDLARMLGAVLEYLTRDDLEELDIEYLFDQTEGLREFWAAYREQNKKELAEEIKSALDSLSYEELEQIMEQIKKYRQ